MSADRTGKNPICRVRNAHLATWEFSSHRKAVFSVIILIDKCNYVLTYDEWMNTD